MEVSRELSETVDLIQKDIEELQQLLSQATRDNTKRVLQSEINLLTKKKELVSLIIMI